MWMIVNVDVDGRCEHSYSINHKGGFVGVV